MPSDRRETACVYVRDGGHVLLLDAGTGFRRLVTEPALLDGVETLHVALSHFHLDHTFGLVGLPAVRAVPVREVWAPGRLVGRSSAEAMLQRLLGPPFLATAPADVTTSFATAVHELDGDTEIGPFRVRVRLQPLHAGPTLAFVVNGELAYCTDTAYDADNADFVRGARTLLHEAVHPADETENYRHSAAGEAARIAAAAAVERLVLVHVQPEVTDDEALLRHARARFEPAVVGQDGMSL